MPTPAESLAKALEMLQELHSRRQFVVASGDLAEVYRARLVKAGYLKPVIRGWYLTSRPDEMDGDTTPWQASWQEFVARYCNKRFGTDWHLSPEQSLHVLTTTPLPSRQILVHAKRGHNNRTDLPHSWSILDLKAPTLAPDTEILNINGLRTLSISFALTQVSEAFFRSQKEAAQIALELLPDISDLVRILISENKPIVGGRMVAALRAVGRDREATEMRKTMEAVGYKVLESDPFETPPTVISPAIKRSPYVLRINRMWTEMTREVVRVFGDPPGLPADSDAYLNDVEARYVADAYNSLSIEGYNVSPELIEKVRTGSWNPNSEEDKRSRDAMAAKGYSLAHDEVKKTIASIFAGSNPGDAFNLALPDWNRSLWTPSVTAGILRPEELAGYRNAQVFIRNADHVPPPREAVRDCMPELFELLKNENHAAVRAVLGHFIFVFIHPYMDGNGRLGRFLMNAMMASGGYPWTVIPMAKRADYFSALNDASGRHDIAPFAKFVNELVTAQTNPEYRPERD